MPKPCPKIQKNQKNQKNKLCLEKTLQAALIEAELDADLHQQAIMADYIERCLFLNRFYNQQPRKKRFLHVD